MNAFYSHFACPPESRCVGMAALRPDPVPQPRVLVLSETQGLFLGVLMRRESRLVTLAPCRRLREDPSGPDIPRILYDGRLRYWVDTSICLSLPRVTLLDALVIVPAPE